MKNRDYILMDVGELALQPNGFLSVPANLTRTGVFTYFDRGPDGVVRVIRQLRSPEEVFNPDTMASLVGLPTTNDHPPEIIEPGNARDYIVGMTSDEPRRLYIPKPGVEDTAEEKHGEDYVSQRVTFFDRNAIDLIKAKKKTALSLGYLCDLDPKPGVWKGQQYDYVQRNIRYNHLSLVDRARGGDNCKVIVDGKEQTESVYLCDGMETNDKRQETKPMKEFEYKGQKFQVDDASFVVFLSLQKDADESRAEAARVKTESEKVQARLDEANEQNEALKEQLKTDNLDAKVAERVALEVVARQYLDDKVDLRKMSDRQVKEAVVKKLRPSISLDGKSEEYVTVRFDCAIEDAADAKKTKYRSGGTTKVEQAMGENLTEEIIEDSEEVYEKARSDSWERSRNAWKPKVAK